MQRQREDWAQDYQRRMLDTGADVRVTLLGPRKTQAKIEWVALSRPLVHRITKDGSLLSGLEEIGFTKVTFTNGFTASWSFRLNPQVVRAEALNRGLAPMGLDKKLAL